MNILVTGATGFVGRHLVEDLSKEGNKIYCVLRNPKKSEIVTKYGAQIMHADVTDKSSLEKIKELNIDIIYHCSGLVESKDIQQLRKINVKATVNICEIAMEFKIPKMIYVSSVAVVSANKQVPLIEDLPLCASNLYGQSKLEAEQKVLEFRKKGLKVCIVRPCMIYGPDEPHLLPLLVNLARRRLLPIINIGKNRLHLGYVKNITAAMIFLANNDKAYEGSFFLTDKEVLSVKEIFTLIAQSIGAKRPLEIPLWLTGIFTKLPYLGVKVKFMLKDRIYSTERLENIGFKWPYEQKQALTESCKSLLTSLK